MLFTENGRAETGSQNRKSGSREIIYKNGADKRGRKNKKVDNLKGYLTLQLFNLSAGIVIMLF